MSEYVVKHLGRQEYAPIWHAMQTFTDERTADTPDEFWVVEHDPVYTLGRATKPEHLLRKNDIPVVPIDRGGQVTYHGPGQLVVYTLVDIKRLGIGVRRLVNTLEESVVALLADHGVTSESRADAPGVYIEDSKIAALGLRIRKGCSFHGLALNVDMDLTPYQDINPCGYAGLAVTQTKDHGITATPAQLADQLLGLLTAALGYNERYTPPSGR